MKRKPTKKTSKRKVIKKISKIKRKKVSKRRRNPATDQLIDITLKEFGYAGFITEIEQNILQIIPIVPDEQKWRDQYPTLLFDLERPVRKRIANKKYSDRDILIINLGIIFGLFKNGNLGYVLHSDHLFTYENIKYTKSWLTASLRNAEYLGTYKEKAKKYMNMYNELKNLQQDPYSVREVYYWEDYINKTFSGNDPY